MQKAASQPELSVFEPADPELRVSPLVLLAAASAAGAVTAGLLGAAYLWRRHRQGGENQCGDAAPRNPGLPAELVSSPLGACDVRDGLAGAIGETPLIYLRSLSELTGCVVLGKAEFLNPGGSSKDRVARAIVKEAEDEGALGEGGAIFEGTAGSTGISLALMARAASNRHRYGCCITMPDDMSNEKAELLQTFGADVRRVKSMAIVNKSHYVREAERAAVGLGCADGSDGSAWLAVLCRSTSCTLPLSLFWRCSALLCFAPSSLLPSSGTLNRHPAPPPPSSPHSDLTPPCTESTP